MLYFIQTTVWKYLFGHNADLLERDQSDDHTCMMPTSPFATVRSYWFLRFYL